MQKRIYFRPGSADALPVRAALLQATLRDHFAPRAANSDAVDLAEAQDPEQLELFLRLRALHPCHSPGTAVFFGLSCAPAQMLGKNHLVCLRPLAEELEDFAARFPAVAALGSGWVRDLLRNFRRCLFVNRSDLSASLGFAPWVEMGLATDIPARIGAPALPDADPVPILLLVHDDTMLETARDLRAALVRFCAPRILRDGQEALDPGLFATSPVHVHLGFRPRVATTLLTPFDTILSGLYGLLLNDPERPDPDMAVLDQLVAQRSYAACPLDATEAEEQLYRICSRLGGLRETGMRFNPEIKRFETLNQAFFEASVKRLEEQMA